uniref:Breast and ovarian cancer susceptibility 2 n=1 Tax=Naja naja TaxID=35670 RepID=A0A8C6YIN7_NAJNA
APPYDVKKTEDLLHKTMDQNTFKTPKGKLSINNSSVSTPMIFKDRNKNVKTFTSPIEKSPKLTQAPHNRVSFRSCPNCCPSNSSKACKCKYINRYYFSEKVTVFHAPKVQTQKCISESLGVEADPDMSWTSSLATPPTLSPTVIIGNEANTIMYGLFSKHGESLKNLESFLNESFDKNPFPVELHGYQKPSNVPKDEDNHGGTNDFSLNIAGSRVFLKKINSVENKKALFYEKNHDELEGAHETIKASNERKCERKLKSSKCNLNTNVPTIQNSVNGKENMPSSLLCPWSQLDLSGLEITQLEKRFMKSISSSSALQVKKTSLGSPSIEKKCSSPKILNSYMLNTPCLIQGSKMSSPEKLSVSKNSHLLTNFSENNYFLKSRTFTESSEIQSIHSDFSRKDKSPSGHLDNISNQTSSDGRQNTKSSLKNISSLSSLKRRPKKFIYAITEKGFHEICHSNTCVDRKTGFANHSSSQEAFIKECTVPMQVSETENKQETLELTAQFLDSGIHSRKASKSKTMVLEKEMDTKLSPLLSLKEGVPDDNQRELGCLCHRKIQKFKGFKTASDKQIVLSADKVRKGKLLFKDIEDQLEDFQNEEKGAISSQNKQENTEHFSVGQNQLNLHVSDSVINSIHSDDMKIGFPEYGNKSIQNVLKNQHPKEKHNLTASQIAEITELSNILEETDSQFEFTQFRKHKTSMYNNTIKTRCFDKKKLNSKNWKDTGFVDDPVDNHSSFKHIDTGECNTDRQSNEKVILLKSNRKEKCFVPIISDPLQSDLGNHSSGKNKDEIARRGTELVRNMDGMGEILNYKIKTDGSNKCSSWHMPMKEIDIDWPQKAKKGNAKYIIQDTTKDTTIAFVKEDMENKLKDVDCQKDSVVQITSTTEVNLKIIQKYSVHVSENELSSTKNQNALPIHHFVNCGKTCCNNNCPETLSDLTCLVEVAKTEKNNTWNDAGAKKSFISEQEEKVSNPEKQYFLQSIHTVTDESIFAEKSKRLNLLTESDIREEMNNVSYCKRKINARHNKIIPSMKESTELNQTEIFFGCNHKNVSENREKQTSGFHTASGKQITFTDRSLLKARHLLSEEALF